MKWKRMKRNLQIPDKWDLLGWVIIVVAALYFGGHLIIGILQKKGIL